MRSVLIDPQRLMTDVVLPAERLVRRAQASTRFSLLVLGVDSTAWLRLFSSTCWPIHELSARGDRLKPNVGQPHFREFEPHWGNGFGGASHCAEA